MASTSAPDHEIIAVTPDMAELRQQCYDVRVAVFVNEQGEFTSDLGLPLVMVLARFLCR